MTGEGDQRGGDWEPIKIILDNLAYIPKSTHTQGTPQDCTHTTISKVKQTKTGNEMGKQETEIGKQETEIYKQETEICKQETEICKPETEIYKQETEICKLEIEISRARLWQAEEPNSKMSCALWKMDKR
jgi:septal ring factor EnvC (AmiA/AmiB activator)